ncbi:MAG: type IV secretion protein DotI [Gammaproteobacteria bacterium CG11_big_fil_rev_8_21_14_0_20_46_22]|nr:MAG: type IV secretion protein DotI [Gammaproteobacteria bacterium CG12_big_fil_rev_8_21_14_0_65_46_12]PIR10547.1 MAG: type IV secretion protein DotI [Gammaproteobacteria bacterium CG11_big_fil_rev_8_21_14_0_20_46_22]
MAHDALETVKLRHNFYRDSYRLVAIILFLSVVVNVLLVGAVFYLETHKPTPKYFATTQDGRLFKMVPLDQPYMESNQLVNWVANAATSLYTYDFLNYRQNFQNNQIYFTPDGWKAYLDQVEKSRNLKTVEDKKLVVSATPAGAPVITNQGVLDGKYSWRVQIPVVVTYQSLSQQFSENLLLTLTIQRRSTLDSKYGVGIAQFVAQQQ